MSSSPSTQKYDVPWWIGLGRRSSRARAMQRPRPDVSTTQSASTLRETPAREKVTTWDEPVRSSTFTCTPGSNVSRGSAVTSRTSSSSKRLRSS
jgi:hypothetical protein